MLDCTSEFDFGVSDRLSKTCNDFYKLFLTCQSPIIQDFFSAVLVLPTPSWLEKENNNLVVRENLQRNFSFEMNDVNANPSYSQYPFSTCKVLKLLPGPMHCTHCKISVGEKLPAAPVVEPSFTMQGCRKVSNIGWVHV